LLIYSFLYDNDGIEIVKGSLFSAKETGLTGNILSPNEAVKRLQEQADFFEFKKMIRLWFPE